MYSMMNPINKNISLRDKIVFNEEKNWEDNKTLDFEINIDAFRDLYRRHFLFSTQIYTELYNFLISNRRAKIYGTCDNFLTIIKHIIIDNYNIKELKEISHFVYANKNNIINYEINDEFLKIEF